MALFIVAEGEGDKAALPGLVGRMRSHLELAALPYPSEKWCLRKPLLSQHELVNSCERARAVRSCEALLLTRDADNKQLDHEDCPKHTVPPMAEWARNLKLPFPVAVVLFYKEYETLFVAGARGMAGRSVKDRGGKVVATISANADAHPDPEYPRDAKAWVRRNLFPGYRPSRHQLLLTEALDLDDLARSQLSSYRRLAKALRFLEANVGVAGAVYPRLSGGRS